MSVLNTIDLEGTSSESWGAAAREALREAARTIRNITRLEVTGMSTRIDGPDVVEYRTQIRLYFTVEPS